MNPKAPSFLRLVIRYLPVIFVGLICLYFIWAGVGIWLFSDATAYERAAGIIFLIAAALGLAGVVVACWCHQPYGALLWFAAIISLCMIVFPLFSNSQDRGLLLSLGFLATIFTLCMTAIWYQFGARDVPADSNAAILEKLREIHEQTMLSDTARRVLYRERELELLRRTIEEDLQRGDFNAALVLCEDMEKLFGYNEEADAARSRVLELRNAALSEDIQQQVTEVHRLLSNGRWRRARLSASRLHRLYPDSPPHEERERNIDVVINERKQALQLEFDQAVSANDTEQSMRLLRELDRYLEPDEAEALRASAQEVISGHRELLKKQFRDAISNHDWKEALRCGERITMEYPMDTMATQAREMMDRLRERADSVESGGAEEIDSLTPGKESQA
ncbi:MAG: hypothetical protein VX527_10530 [Planctomycetota bacterium]|nr:hypothetical protein [Planctomycetota bacterium]